MKQQHTDECQQLRQQVNQVLRHEYDRRQLEDRLSHYQNTSERAELELQRLRNTLEALQAENAFWSESRRNQNDENHPSATFSGGQPPEELGELHRQLDASNVRDVSYGV